MAFLPWLLFGVVSGAIVDRVDRRRTLALANFVRMAMAALIAVCALTGSLSIWLLYAAVLVIGIGETFYDNSTIAIVPSLITRDGLERANGRMQASDLVVQNFLATPVAGVLFALRAALPMVATTAGYLISAVLAFTLPHSAGRAARPEHAEHGRGLRREIGEVVSFLRSHRVLRSLVLLTSVVGALSAFGQAVLVLFVVQTLAVPEAAFGLVTAVIGLGALAGALVASPLVSRFGRGRAMLIGLTAGSAGLLLAGFAPSIWVMAPVFALSAFGISIWNVPWGAFRQDVTPGHLLGRTIGLIRTLTWGIMPIGALLGGLVGRLDLRLPLIIGGALMLLTTAAALPLLLRRIDGVPSAEA